MRSSWKNMAEEANSKNGADEEKTGVLKNEPKRGEEGKREELKP